MMNFSNVVILCLGDVMLDRFAHGEIERISPEAPIPIMRQCEVREMLGGTGNVASNVAALGGRARLIGLVGDDVFGTRLRALVDQTVGIEACLITTRARPTICKTRFIAGRQQIVRMDEESQLGLQAEEEDAILAMLKDCIGGVHAVILSDYGKGVLSPRVVAETIAIARLRGLPVFVDPKVKDFSRYSGATCITPNLKELALGSGLPVDDEASVIRAARTVLTAAGAEAVLATRSEKGMVLAQANGETFSVGTRTREVFDVSGAGDTVIATMTLAYASGLSLEQSMNISNAAAGVVVSKHGTATATVDEILHELDEQEHAAGGALPSLRSPEQTLMMVRRWRAQGLRVGFANGCFDLIHPGHVSLLKGARAACDHLIVGLNTDDSVRRLKGSSRPVNRLPFRAGPRWRAPYTPQLCQQGGDALQGRGIPRSGGI